jgi:hypothetical protein
MSNDEDFTVSLELKGKKKSFLFMYHLISSCDVLSGRRKYEELAQSIINNSM